MPNYEADRAETLHSLWASFSQLLVEKNERVMSGHGAMTSQEVQRQIIFVRNGGLEGDIDHDEASFGYVRS